jgi:hypothetical protein
MMVCVVALHASLCYKARGTCAFALSMTHPVHGLCFAAVHKMHVGTVTHSQAAALLHGLQ